LLSFGYKINYQKHDDDETTDYYSKYLGPNWRENKFEGKRVSTLISNHIGFLEILCYMSIMTPPAFTPAHFV